MTFRLNSSNRHWAATGVFAAVLLSGSGASADPALPVSEPTTTSPMHQAHAEVVLAETPTPGAALFVCPMHPQIQQETPGTCPLCGMQLVQRLSTANQAIDTGTRVPLAIDAGRLQRLGIRLSPVEHGALQLRIRAAGEVIALPGDVVDVQARTAGWVEAMGVRQTGMRVEAGAVLAELYLPEVERLRSELMLEPALAAGSAERLRRLGIAARDVEALRAGRLERRLPLRAPQAGIVTMIDTSAGARVSPGQTLIRIEPHNRRWIEARLPATAAFAIGASIAGARMLVPGRRDALALESRWVRSDRVDPDTQTVAWRTPLPGTITGLVTGRYVEIELYGSARAATWLVPRSAVLRHAQEDRLIVRDPSGQLTLRRVRLGESDGRRVEVLEGVAHGDAVVTRSAFLLEAEAEIDGLLADWGQGSLSPADHNHD